MIRKCALIFMGTLLVFCESAFVDTLQKCAIDDGICQKNLIKNILEDISKDGVAELNIPPIDPLKLKNIAVPILGLINITLDDGVVKGIKDCSVDSMIAGVEDRHAILDITCDLNIKGKFKVAGTSPLLENLFRSNSIRGDGNAKVKLEKLKMKFEFFYDILRKEDGDIYFKCHPEKTLYQYVIGNGKVAADKIYLGDQDASDLVVTFLNENLKFVLDTFGKSFFNVATEIFKEILHKFFDFVAAKHFITSDLSSYVKS